jgi:hypothetical protein
MVDWIVYCMSMECIKYEVWIREYRAAYIAGALLEEFISGRFLLLVIRFQRWGL